MARNQMTKPPMLTLLAAAALTALTAIPPAGARQAAAPRQTVMTAPRPAGDPIMAIVSIKSQHVTFYDADGWILRAPVSTGTTGRETPAGVFAVIEKNKDHHSTMYDDAWMPNMLRITWNGIALHGGPLPGYAASHGCVRMPFDFAAKVFDKAPMGMRVIISPTDAEPVAFSDPALFQPKQDAIDAIPARAAALARDADDAARAAAAAKAALMPAKRAAAAAPAAVRNLAFLTARADAELARADKALAAANADPKATDQRKAAVADAQQKAAAKAAALHTQRDAAKADVKTKQDAAAAAQAAAKAADAERNDTAKAATEARLASEPVAIYISRTTRTLYVRRDTHKPWPDGGEVYDFSQQYPVAIKDPDKPLGTHIFTAVARDGGGLRWTEVSIDNGDSAKNALGRITFPQAVLDKIAPTAVPLSSIIISDEPLSSETNYRTEFVAVLSNQPQGGFITRMPSQNTMARDDGGYGYNSGWYGGGYAQPQYGLPRAQNYFYQRRWW
ncbi:MAG TPA: L,D-transpeptidase family protein [Xanthobacteraceae bacterium]|nr:L,D-transpeptidase family protein [Xanthobacteraceae bacterium]